MGKLLSDEEMTELLTVVDCENITYTTKDNMIWIQTSIHNAIVDYIKAKNRYPGVCDLLHIYEIEFNSKYDIIADDPDLYFYCDNMVRTLKTQIPYTIHIDRNDKSIKLEYFYPGY